VVKLRALLHVILKVRMKSNKT